MGSSSWLGQRERVISAEAKVLYGAGSAGDGFVGTEDLVAEDLVTMAYYAGAAAWSIGALPGSNPYPAGMAQHGEWAQGHARMVAVAGVIVTTELNRIERLAHAQARSTNAT